MLPHPSTGYGSQEPCTGTRRATEAREVLSMELGTSSGAHSQVHVVPRASGHHPAYSWNQLSSPTPFHNRVSLGRLRVPNSGRGRRGELQRGRAGSKAGMAGLGWDSAWSITQFTSFNSRWSPLPSLPLPRLTPPCPTLRSRPRSPQPALPARQPPRRRTTRNRVRG